MKKLVISLLSVAAVCNLYAQSEQEYNSICVFDKTGKTQ